jgi:hypothetical protein
MPILPKGKPNHLLERDVSQDPNSDSIAWELTAHHRSGKNVIAADYILRNLDKPTVVFGWDVQGADDLHDRLAIAR